MQSTAKKAALPAITLAALGVVFGDIGTSPLYALRQCFLTRTSWPSPMLRCWAFCPLFFGALCHG